MSKKLKVFHGLVNYGTQAGLLAKGLRDLGIEAKAYTMADTYYRQTDYHFRPRKTLAGKIFFYKIWYPFIRLSCFFRYNTFHFYFGRTLLKHQWDLPLYRWFNKKVVMEYLGNDIRHYESLVKRYNLPKSHDYTIRMNTHDSTVRKRSLYENKYIDYLISCLPTHIDFAKEYNIHVKETVPLAIDVKSIEFHSMKNIGEKEEIRILHTPTNRIFKGTEYIEKAIMRLKEEGFPINWRLVENVNHSTLMEEYQKCDLFIDQISVGWYGTAALEAMAVGRPTCAFIDERYFQYIDYADEIPILKLDKENIVDQLREIIKNKTVFPVIGKNSRVFVEKLHDVNNVSKKLLKIYQEKLWVK